ncbi:glycosyltransferase family 4 protein [Mycolicibacterium sp. S2-37]|uniref:glycosyltransferase family 4 protein n=1 Tax=Mycolicibacterium sp. S2-37 TaxID=2810297 RepID=UPI001A93E6DF|nr:glycosyltransferase family 1 protein [Mycolicibacterium sp. S2-37]MBO0681406.1 glycosyltransferase family 4 protein [Mycolicibacterium sp. S2-37]
MGRDVDLLFDARHIQQSGIGTYIRTELPYLEEAFDQRGLSLAVLADQSNCPQLRDTTRVVVSEPASAPMYSRQEQAAWAHAVNEVRPRSMWVPHYPFPFALFRPRHRRTKLFVTVHDILHIQEHDITGQNWTFRAYARTMLNLGARRSTRIFTPSHSTADALTAAIPSAPVTVTPLPVEDAWFQPADPARSPVDGPFLLYVGNTKWHKNLALLIEAFADVAQGLPHKLVIAGGGESVKNFDDRIRVLAEQADKVQIVGRVDFDALRALVARADLLVMPSLYEGVGLPPLEAMASHTAVLASNIPALRETCADGAEYFDPRDHRALARLIATYGKDESARTELASRGWAYVMARQGRISRTAAAEAICADLEAAP